MKPAIELISEERARQLAVEGYTPAHDDSHDYGQLGAAAITYVDAALAILTYKKEMLDAALSEVVLRWPWEEESFKPNPDPIRNLVKAGALILAEIERLQRATK